MAIDRPLLTNKSVFACKLEDDTGIAEALTAAEGVYNVFNFQYREESPTEQRQGQGSSTPLPRVPGAIKGIMTFSTELYGGGSTPVPVWADTLLAACCFNKSTATFKTNDPNATFFPTLTMAGYQDGELKSMSGAQGKLTIRLGSAQKGMIDWEFWGCAIDPTDTALIAPTYPTTIPPRWSGTTNTLGGAAIKAAEIVITVDTLLSMRQHPDKASGYLSACVGGHNVTVSLAPEAVLMATKNWRADFLASATSALSLVLGSATNNTITLSAPALSLVDPPQDEARENVRTRRLNFESTRGVAAGNDALSLVFS